jgi:hypothetical protein
MKSDFLLVATSIAYKLGFSRDQVLTIVTSDPFARLTHAKDIGRLNDLTNRCASFCPRLYGNIDARGSV